MGSIITRKLKAGTLVEAIVSMTIISVILGVTVLIFGQLLKANNTVIQFQCESFIQREIQHTIRDSLYANEQIVTENLVLKKEIISNDNRLVWIKFSVFTLNGNFLKKQEVILPQ
jgi:hypothetical protein